MKKLMYFVVRILWVLATLGYLLAVASQYVSPEKTWLPAFAGLLFPFWLTLQILFALWWLFNRKLLFLVSLGLMLLTMEPILNTFQLVGKPQEMDQVGGIHVMSYNVRLLDFFNWSGNPYAGDSILMAIQREKPSILCMQEFVLEDEGRYSLENIKERFSFAPYFHMEFNYHGYKRNHGVAMFSKYPILEVGKLDFDRSANMVMYADMKIDGQMVRVYNAHLQSVHIQAEEELKGFEATRAGRVFHKLKNAFSRRADQTDILKNHIDLSPYPVIVCGDFNDTPVSYTVHKVGSDLTDSFRESGSGFGASYQYLPWLRIDYIMHDPSMNSYDFRTGELNGSDHRPVMCMIKLPEK